MLCIRLQATAACFLGKWEQFPREQEAFHLGYKKGVVIATWESCQLIEETTNHCNVYELALKGIPYNCSLFERFRVA